MKDQFPRAYFNGSQIINGKRKRVIHIWADGDTVYVIPCRTILQAHQIAWEYGIFKVYQ